MGAGTAGAVVANDGVAATGLVDGAASTPTDQGSGPAMAPPFADGLVVSPLAPVEAPTAVRFGPGDGRFGEAGAGDDRPDLYAATLTGDVVRYHLTWSPAGPAVRDRTVAASGFEQPLGIAFRRRGAPSSDRGRERRDERATRVDLLVSDSHANEHTGRTDGTILLVGADGDRQTLLDGLRNGRHNTNHLTFGPDDRLYVGNGNTTDDGCAGGDPEVLPYSGAVLAVDVDDIEDDSAVLHWTDDEGEFEVPEVLAQPVNDDFRERVDVVAHGFRNVYGLAFDADGVLHTGMNGADDPASPDAFYRLDELADGEPVDYRFPFCYPDGPAGVTGEDVGLRPNPAAPDHDCYLFANVDSPSDLDCDAAAHPTADAVLGWHVCATGLDFPGDGAFAFPESYRTDAFVGECGTFTAGTSAERTVESGDGRNTGHSVAHVPIEDGEVAGVRDFVTGLSLPTDVEFGPEGAMYVADLEAIYRVQPVA